MPWSPWQDQLDILVAPSALRVEANLGSHDPGEHGFVQFAISNLQLLSRVSHDELGYTIGRFDLLQFTAADDWDTRRDWFPTPLRSMVEGVDYAARPDRDPLSDDDAYVEYEAGANVHATWAMPTVTVISPMSAVHTTGDGGPSDGTAVGTLEVMASTYPSLAGADVGPMPTGAVIWTEGMGQTGSFTPAAPTWLSFAFTIATSSVDTPVDTAIGWGVELSQRPTQIAQSPRWRYWIPDDVTPPPLRQRQRDDGLGMSGAGRWKGGTSRQGSNRWKGYL